jgi:hypothetical protein
MRDHANERGGVPIVPGGRLHDTNFLAYIAIVIAEYRAALQRAILLGKPHQEDRNAPHRYRV